MSEELVKGIQFYFDENCKESIKKVEWDSGFHVTMASGKVENLSERKNRKVYKVVREIFYLHG